MNYQGNQRNLSARDVQGVKVDENRIKKILAGDAKELNEYAKALGDWYAKGKEGEKLTTSQIRNVLDEIQKMKDYDDYRLQMLMPKLAYAAGRHKGKVREFRKLMEALIKNTNKANFSNFKNFVEAIVAYHKFHGGK